MQIIRVLCMRLVSLCFTLRCSCVAPVGSRLPQNSRPFSSIVACCQLLSLLHLHPCCFFILVASLSLLRLYPRCIFILVASLSLLHLYPCCIFVLVASFLHYIFILLASLSSLHLYHGFSFTLIAYISTANWSGLTWPA